MAKIDIRRPHALTLAQARREAQTMAEHLKQEFDLVSQWDGNRLSFRRAGVDGVMVVDDEAVHVAAELGFLVSFLKGQIEERLHAHFDDVFGPPGAPAAKKKAPAKKAAAARGARPRR